MTYNTDNCRTDVFRRGEVISIEHLSMVDAERRVNEFRRYRPTYFVDWYYSAGRVVFKQLRKPWWRRIVRHPSKIAFICKVCWREVKKWLRAT